MAMRRASSTAGRAVRRAEGGGAVEEGGVEGLAAFFGGLDGDAEGIQYGRLADALGEGAGAEVPLVLALLGGGVGEDRFGRRGSGPARGLVRAFGFLWLCRPACSGSP